MKFEYFFSFKIRIYEAKKKSQFFSNVWENCENLIRKSKPNFWSSNEKEKKRSRKKKNNSSNKMKKNRRKSKIRPKIKTKFSFFFFLRSRNLIFLIFKNFKTFFLFLKILEFKMKFCKR